MPHLARHLQESFEQNCPTGWVCRTEVNVVSDELAEMLGYAPQADAMLQEVATGRRVWVELEVSRADPVANHAKFATAHLVSPMPRRASAFPLQMKPAVTDSRYKFESARPFHASKPTPLTYGQMAISPWIVRVLKFSISKVRLFKKSLK